MQDGGEFLPLDAKPVRGFFYGQPLANDEADRRPVQGGFGPSVVLVLHLICCARPPNYRDAQGNMLRAKSGQINRHKY